jgi:hypothetical protein
MTTAHLPRQDLSRPLSEHDQAAAATLVNIYTHATTLTAAAEVGVDTIRDVDVVKGDPTDASFTVKLPLGSADIDGHVYTAIKLSASGNSFGWALQGTDEFEDEATTLTTATENAQLSTYWDHASGLWRFVAASTVVSTTADSFTATDAMTIGDGTGSPTLTMDKVDAGSAFVLFQVDGTTRWTVGTNSGEDFFIQRHASNGDSIDAISYDDATGLVALPAAVTIGTTLVVNTSIQVGGLVYLGSDGAASFADGGISLNADSSVSCDGNLTAAKLIATSGGLDVTGAAKITIGSVEAYADDAAAAVGGVPVGGIYRTASALKIRAA